VFFVGYFFGIRGFLGWIYVCWFLFYCVDHFFSGVCLVLVCVEEFFVGYMFSR